MDSSEKAASSGQVKPERRSPSDVRRLWDALEHQVQLKGYDVVLRRLEHPRRGMTLHQQKRVVISDRLNDIEAVTRLAHETGHVYLHAAIDDATEEPRAIREIEAELLAYSVLTFNGIKPGAGSFERITRWAVSMEPKVPERLVEQLLDRTKKTTRGLRSSVARYLQEYSTSTDADATQDRLPRVPAGDDGPGL